MPTQEVLRKEQIDVARAREAEVRRRQAAHVESLVEQIRQAREDVDKAVMKLVQVSSDLRSTCRRNFDEASSSYIVFANSHLRLAGAVGQGVRRAASMDRVLSAAAREREDAKQRADELRRQQEVREHQRLVAKLQAPTDNAFNELFGEIVDASE